MVFSRYLNCQIILKRETKALIPLHVYGFTLYLQKKTADMETDENSGVVLETEPRDQKMEESDHTTLETPCLSAVTETTDLLKPPSVDR